jgi:hypothetical protein
MEPLLVIVSVDPTGSVPVSNAFPAAPPPTTTPAFIVTVMVIAEPAQAPAAIAALYTL